MLRTNGNPKNSDNRTSDFVLVDRALDGDQSAYEELFQKHRKRIFYFFMRSTNGNSADSEDFVQETFKSAFLKLHTFKNNASFYTWLYTIAVNVFLMSCRSKKPGLISIDDLHSQQIADRKLSVEAVSDNRTRTVKKSEIGKLDQVLENVPNEILVSQLMRDLPPGYKKTLELHDLQGLGYKEVAVKLRCSLGNAKSQRHKAIMKLRAAVQISSV